jgi:hypothetical protein
MTLNKTVLSTSAQRHDKYPFQTNTNGGLPALGVSRSPKRREVTVTL